MISQFLRRHFFLVAYIAISFMFINALATRLINEFERDPLTIQSATPDANYTLKAGEQFEFWREVCVNKDMVITVHREFYNVDTADRYMMPSINYGAAKGDGCFSVRFLGYVPEDIQLGLYLYRPTLVYALNSDKTISKHAPPIKVEVVE